MSYGLIIFDCDGVLFDSLDANTAFYNQIRRHFGLEVMSPEETAFVHTATNRDAIHHIMPNDELRAAARKYCATVDFRAFDRFLRLEPDLRDLLEFLGAEYKKAVCTNRGHSVHGILERFNLADHFDQVVTWLDVERPKPDPEPLRLILDTMKVRAADALYIGDAETDARAAQAAQVPFAAYRNRGLEARYHLERLGQVREILRMAAA